MISFEQEMKKYKTAIHLFIMTFIQYAVLTFNIRAVAVSNYFALAATDLIIAMLGFTILKKIEQAEGPIDMMGYAIGGTIGAQFAMFFGNYFIK